MNTSSIWADIFAVLLIAQILDLFGVRPSIGVLLGLALILLFVIEYFQVQRARRAYSPAGEDAA